MIKFVPPSEEELAARGIGLEVARAREDDGTFRADDPATSPENEAWVKKPRSRKKGSD